MVKKTKQYHQIQPLMVLLMSLTSSFAANNLKLIFDDIKCVPLNGYVENFTCTVDKTIDASRLSVDIQMKKEVQEARFDFYVYIKSVNREPFTVFKGEGIRYCSSQARDADDPIYMTLKETLKRAGTLPDGCPIPADFRYFLPNISINTDLLPSFAPKAGFKIVLVYYNRKIKYMTITALGRLDQIKMKNKGRRHFLKFGGFIF